MGANEVIRADSSTDNDSAITENLNTVGNQMGVNVVVRGGRRIFDLVTLRVMPA
jgi:hypothetical protein